MALSTGQWEGWLVADRVQHLVYFIGRRAASTPTMGRWEEVLVHALKNRRTTHGFSWGGASTILGDGVVVGTLKLLDNDDALRDLAGIEVTSGAG